MVTPEAFSRMKDSSPSEKVEILAVRQAAEEAIERFILNRLDQLTATYEGHFDADVCGLIQSAYRLGFGDANLKLGELL